MRFASAPLTLLITTIYLTGCYGTGMRPPARVVTSVEDDGKGGFRTTKCTLVAHRYGGISLGRCEEESGLSDVVYVPSPNEHERTVSPIKACRVLRKHAGEFSRYWRHTRRGAAGPFDAPTASEFEAFCIDLPIALKRCTYEPYRSANAVECTLQFESASGSDLQKIDALYLGEGGSESNARTSPNTREGDPQLRVINW